MGFEYAAYQVSKYINNILRALKQETEKLVLTLSGMEKSFMSSNHHSTTDLKAQKSTSISQSMVMVLKMLHSQLMMPPVSTTRLSNEVLPEYVPQRPFRTSMAV
jgi:hypothetical protein